MQIWSPGGSACFQFTLYLSFNQDEEDWLVQGRFGGEAGGWEDAEEGEGLTRESGQPVENSQVIRCFSIFVL